MSPSGSITVWIQNLRSPDAEMRNAAASAIWECYSRQLLAVARRFLSPRIRQREDEQDVLQDMYISFVAQVRRGQIEPHNRDDLWRVLITMTINKSRTVSARHLRHKRSIFHEQPGYDSHLGSFDHNPLEQVADVSPSAEELTLLKDTLEQLLAALPSPTLQQIVLWKFESFTNEEIAEKLGCAERTVERKLHLIRLKWAELGQPGPVPEELTGSI